jgi:hypothetical protein
MLANMSYSWYYLSSQALFSTARHCEPYFHTGGHQCLPLVLPVHELSFALSVIKPAWGSAPYRELFLAPLVNKVYLWSCL